MQLLIAMCLLLAAVEPTHEVKLVTGEVLRGRVIEQTPQHVILEHGALGKIEIASAAVAEVRDLTAAGPVTKLAADEPFLPQAQPVEGKWKSRFDLGMSSRSGVSDETDLRLGLKTAYDSPSQKYRFESSYYYRRSEGVVSDNKFNLTAFGDWPLRGSRWSFFSQGTYDYDSFQSWQHRVTGGGGMGYVLVRLDEIDATGKWLDTLVVYARAGAGFRREFGSLDDDIQPEAIIGTNLNWRMTDRQQLNFGLTLYPDLQTADFRAVSKAEWVYNLADLWQGLNLVIGYAYEYQSDTDPGINHNDMRIYASVGIGF